MPEPEYKGLKALGELVATTAGKVTPVVIALVLIGFVINSRLGKYLARLMMSGTEFLVAIGERGL